MIKPNQDLSEQKANGRYYTPSFLVRNILDLAGYQSSLILQKHIIDNSCGDGAFLAEIVDRYCREFLQTHRSQTQLKSRTQLKKELSEYIHGIEIERTEWEKCIVRLDEIASRYNVQGVSWDISCADTLDCKRYQNRMDFVVGNPPYVRVHNLNETYQKIKEYRFSQSGMTDLFIVFYEIGLDMLCPDGILAYITPSSIFNSLAGSLARKNFIQTQRLHSVVDLKHFQAFEATTYTAIVVLQNNKKNDRLNYYEYDSEKLQPRLAASLTFDDIYIDDHFYFGTEENLKELREILTNQSARSYVEVKNGFATLCDSFFIGNFDFTDYVIPIVKASTGKQYQCIFPYRNGKLVSWEQIQRCPKLSAYYNENKMRLEKRSIESKGKWYGFGRSQGILDVGRKKIAINSLIRSLETIKMIEMPPGSGVYSGLYILADSSFTCEQIKEIIISESFLNYISMLSKYKSGGYWTFSSKDLKKYLDYKLSERDSYDVKQRFFEFT